MEHKSQIAGRSEANLRFTRKLAALQLTAVAALAIALAVAAALVLRGQGSPAAAGAAFPLWIAVGLPIAAGAVVLLSVLLSRHAVASARRLERAVEAAQAADWAKTEFLSNVSHELRTPMNGILGMAQLMQTMQLDEKLRKMVDVVATSARSQMTLIEELIDVSTIDSGFRGLSNAPFGPVAALGEVCGIMELKAEAKGIGLVVSAPDEAGQQVLGDIACFKQILTNLIDNGVKFTERGKVEVTLGLTLRNDQTWVRVEVADTGPGISRENHERVFARFGRLDGQLARSARGMGLGLPITKALVELMGGSIGLQSELGKGARFTVEIPFEQPIYPAVYRGAA